VVEALQSSGEHVDPAPRPAAAALAEETAEVLRWLDQPGVRLVRADTPWVLPAACGGDVAARLSDARRAAQRWLADEEQVGAAARPRGPADAQPVTRMLSA
jgi:DNA polymerase-3 subunit epsilon